MKTDLIVIFAGVVASAMIALLIIPLVTGPCAWRGGVSAWATSNAYGSGNVVCGNGQVERSR